MPPKTRVHLKSYDGQTKLMYFLIEDDDLFEKYILFVIKSALILKKNSIANLFTLKIF